MKRKTHSLTAAAAFQSQLAERGLTCRQLARKVNLKSEAYLLQLWRRGGASCQLADNLGRHLGVPSQVFLWGFPHHQKHLHAGATFQDA